MPISLFIRKIYGRMYQRWSAKLNKPISLISTKGETKGSKLTSKEIGDLGELIAYCYLKSTGCKVLYRNYRGPKGGEVDIAAREQDTLIFVEVKTRTSKGFGRPLDAVDADKQELIERGANSWLQLLGSRDVLWRFDVIEVILTEGVVPEVVWVKNAF